MSAAGMLSVKAAAVARKAKYNKPGKAEHESRVAAALSKAGFSDDIIAVGWLHDVVENSTTTLKDLKNDGFPDHILDAVEALTSGEDEKRKHYLKRVADNPIAVIVKYFDMNDHTKPSQLAGLTAAQREKIEAKYDKSRKFLFGEATA